MEVKLIKLLLLFLSPLLVLFGAAEYCLSKADNSYSIKRKTLDKKAETLELVFMGTSHTCFSINPALFKEPSLNLANLGQPVKYDCEIILKYLPRLKHLKLVVLPVEYLTLFYDVETTPSRGYLYYKYWGIGDVSLPKYNIKKYSLLALFKPSTSINMTAEMIHERKMNIQYQTNGMLENGYLPKIPPRDTVGFEKEAASKIARWEQTLMSPKYFNNNTYLVESLVKLLQGKNIRVLLISTPVTPNFYKKYNTDYVNKKNEFIRYITTAYKNTSYADFTSDQRFPITDFTDPNHLNSTGATRFSSIIRDEYIEPMLH
jgi:hypothetical protein